MTRQLQALVDELLGVFDAIQVDLADRQEAADAIHIHGQPAFVGGSHAGLDDHPFGHARPVGVNGNPLSGKKQEAIGLVISFDVDVYLAAQGGGAFRKLRQRHYALAAAAGDMDEHVAAVHGEDLALLSARLSRLGGRLSFAPGKVAV